MASSDVSIGFVVGEGSDEVRAALERFPAVQQVAAEALADEDLSRFAVLWWHAAKDVPLSDRSDTRDRLLDYLEGGGGLLLSLLACPLLHSLGVESKPFDEVYSGAWDTDEKSNWKWDFIRNKGFQCAFEHPLFRGLDSCVYTWQSALGKHYCRAGYVGRYPTRGRVVAVRKNFIHIDHNTPEILEYSLGQGRILAVSSFMFFADDADPRYSDLMRFAENALLYTAGEVPAAKARYWPSSELVRAQQEQGISQGPSLGGIEHSQEVTLQATQGSAGLSLETDTSEFFDLAGRRCLVCGHTDGRVDEIWGHPVRLAKDVKVEFETGGRPYPVTHTARRSIISPYCVTIEHCAAGRHIRQTIFAAMECPGALISFEAEAETEIRLQFGADLRIMWPYPAHMLGPLTFRTSDGQNVLLLSDASGEHSMAFGVSGVSARALRAADPQGSANRLWIEARCIAKPGKPVACAFAGGRCRPHETLDALRMLIEHGSDLQRQAVSYYERLAHQMTCVSSPDQEFDDGYSWAKVGVDKMFAATPGIGSGFLAGYSTTGKSAFSEARPGYAWYFGRDSEYTALAVDAYGDTAKVRENLSLLMDSQHAGGKIIHEVTTSGVAHYDAADSTPLFVILMEHYLRSSGDTSFVESGWPSVKRAMDFLYSTDADGDGLIENTGIGHGWIEGGSLSPTHVSFDLAGVWAHALRCASRLALEAGDAHLSERWRADFERVKSRLNLDFWDAVTGWFAFSKNRDGSYTRARTALATIPMCFGLVDPEKALPVLSSLATHDYSSDWGVRLIGESNPDFDPKGYHQGSVWPLFTGWVARAEYEYHGPLQGFVHLMSNLLLYRHGGARGYVPEVLHGQKYQFAGVCPHQAWSESMVLYPAVEGLLGIFRDVPRNRLRIAPHLPPHWDRLSVKSIPFGDGAIDMEIEQTLTGAVFAFRATGTRPVRVELSPGIANLRSIANVSINGRETAYEVKDFGQDAHVTCHFTLGESAVAAIDYCVDLWVVPPVPRPEPGDVSKGLRVLEVIQGGHGEVGIEVEGIAGAAGRLSLLSGRPIKRAAGARVDRSGPTEYVLHIPFEGNGRWCRKNVIVSVE